MNEIDRARVLWYRDRLLCEFPEWSNEQALTAAESIIKASREIEAAIRRDEFEAAVLADLDALPVAG